MGIVVHDPGGAALTLPNPQVASTFLKGGTTFRPSPDHLPPVARAPSARRQSPFRDRRHPSARRHSTFRP
jgi:hypothetical protein